MANETAVPENVPLGIDLSSILKHPDRAEDCKYNLLDKSGNIMQSVSIIDIDGQAFNNETWRYAAVYHTPTLVHKGSVADDPDLYRFAVNVAVSNDLIVWTFCRRLVDNADMPEIRAVSGTGNFLLVHEQWMAEGNQYRNSLAPCRVGFRLYRGAADLLGVQTSPDTVALATPEFVNENSLNAPVLNGTPNIYQAIGQPENDLVNGAIGFHYFKWNDNGPDRDLCCNAAIGNVFSSGQRNWWTSQAQSYNEKLTSMGVTGNIGMRTNVVVATAVPRVPPHFGVRLLYERYNVQEANKGVPEESWGSWRIFLYKYAPGEPVWPTGEGEFTEIRPVTPHGSKSFGNPRVSVVSHPNLPYPALALCVSYVLFSEGAAKCEAGNLLYYYHVPNSSIFQQPQSEM